MMARATTNTIIIDQSSTTTCSEEWVLYTEYCVKNKQAGTTTCSEECVQYTGTVYRPSKHHNLSWREFMYTGTVYTPSKHHNLFWRACTVVQCTNQSIITTCSEECVQYWVHTVYSVQSKQATQPVLKSVCTVLFTGTVYWPSKHHNLFWRVSVHSVQTKQAPQPVLKSVYSTLVQCMYRPSKHHNLSWRVCTVHCVQSVKYTERPVVCWRVAQSATQLCPLSSSLAGRHSSEQHRDNFSLAGYQTLMLSTLLPQYKDCFQALSLSLAGCQAAWGQSALQKHPRQTFSCGLLCRLKNSKLIIVYGTVVTKN